MINEWWDKHHSMGGSVWSVQADWNLIDSPQDWIDNIFAQYRDLSFEQVLEFTESDVTDNSMHNRDILEEGSKIYYLTEEMRNYKINFVPQLIHEPWNNRYRIHPGSGRTAALWLNEYKKFPCLYVHFAEGDFEIPNNSMQIENVTDLIQAVCFQRNSKPEFEFYPATICERTRQLDREWNYVSVQPWEFIRWSEGTNFLNYKKSWRENALDLWFQLTKG